MSDQPYRPSWMGNDPVWFKGTALDTQPTNKLSAYCKLLKDLSLAIEQTIKVLTVWNDFWTSTKRR